MRVISRKALKEHWDLPGRQDSEMPLKSWFKVATSALWRSPADVKAQYGNCSIVGNERIVFNIKGNTYRLIVEFNFRASEPIAFIRFVGTHAEYDKIDAREI